MAQPSFALPDQLRYNHAALSSLGTYANIAVCVPYMGSWPITVQTSNYFIVNVPKSGNNCVHVFDPVKIFYVWN